MGGSFWLGVSAERRAAAGITPGHPSLQLTADDLADRAADARAGAEQR